MKFRIFGAALALALASLGWGQFPPEILERQKEAESKLQKAQPDIQFLKVGGVMDRVYGAPVYGGNTAEESASNYMQAYTDLFCGDEGYYVYEGTQPLDFGHFKFVYFNQFLEGVRVEGAGVSLLVKEWLGNPVVLAVNRAQCVTGPIPKPRLSAQAAVNAFKNFDSSFRTIGKPELCIYKGEVDQHLTWKFLVTGGYNTMIKEFTVFVDAVDGEIVHMRNEIHEVDVNGSVKGWVSPGQRPDVPTNPEVLVGLPNLAVTLQGGATVFTDQNGNFTIPNAGITPVTVSAGMTGRWVNVINNGGTTQSNSVNVTPPGPANIIHSAGLTEFEVAQTNAFLQVNKVHDFIKAQNASYPGVDISITCNVNQANTCNANFQSGNLSINFFNAGGACPNTAYTSVVHHEYGHFVINRAGTSQGGYGEGMSDTISCLLADDPCLGLEFNSPGCLRHAVNTIHYPENSGSAIHTAGMMVSGAFWETVIRFESTQGHAYGLNLMRRLAVNSILARPPGITPGLTVDVLTLDDDDANLTNGTPHYEEIAFGFGKKGLTAPPVEWIKITNTGSPTEFVQFTPFQDTAVPFSIRIEEAARQPDIPTAKLWTRVNGGAWTSQDLVEIVDPGFMLQMVDVPACGSTLDWYVSCKDVDGHEVFFPAGGASAPVSTIVGISLQTMIDDTFETALPGWSIVNNAALTSGGWVRADPIGTTQNGLFANPENDSGDAGVQCYFTGQGAVGGAVGSADVDGGPTELLSPVFDLAGQDGIVSYNRWFYSVGGAVDTFTVSISNNGGSTWTTLETVTGVFNTWVPKSFRVGAFITPTNNMRIKFSATDTPNDSVTEAGVDKFVIKKIICN